LFNNSARNKRKESVFVSFSFRRFFFGSSFSFVQKISFFFSLDFFALRFEDSFRAPPPKKSISFVF